MKKLFALCLAAVVALGLAACGGWCRNRLKELYLLRLRIQPLLSLRQLLLLPPARTRPTARSASFS